MRIGKPVCSECLMTWLLLGDGGVCLACREAVYWIGPERKGKTQPKESNDGR